MTRTVFARIPHAICAGLALLALSGCGSSPGDGDGAGGLTVSQADALNRAAARLDAAGQAASDPQSGLNPAATAAARADRSRTPPSE